MTGAGPVPAMQATNLEALVPGLAELRASEQANRALAFTGLTGSLCGVEVVQLTPAHRLRLQLLRNAFTTAVRPLAGDVFTLLWVLSPYYEASNGLRARVRQWFLRRHVKRIDLDRANAEIRGYIDGQLQDSPASSSGDEGQDFSAYLHWMGVEAGFWLNVHGGFTLEQYMTTPYLVLQQLHRVWQVNHPVVTRNDKGEVLVEEPQFINRSDAVVGAWHRQHREAIAQAIRSQTERLN